MSDSEAPAPDAASAELARLRARVAALEVDREARAPRHRARSFLAALLIVVGCVLAPLSVVASWASEEVGDTDRYVATVAPLASDPDVQNAVANRVTNAVMDKIDIDALLADVAPADRPRLEKALGKLGGALDNAVRGFVHDKARAIVASDAFATFWKTANRDIHSAVDKALTGSGGGAVKLEGDKVTLDLAPVIDRVKQRLVDDGMTVAGRIPEIHTDFTVVEAENLDKVKSGFRLLQIVGNWLPVLAVLLIAAGVLLSARRHRALVAGALGAALATALLGVVLTVFRDFYLDALPSGVSQPAAGSVYDTMTRFLRGTVRTVVVLGVLIAVAAWLSGPGPHAGRVRGAWLSGIAATRAAADRTGMRTGPVGPWLRRHRTTVTWLLVAVAAVVFVLWSYPTAWVVVGIALVLLLALAVVHFLADEPGPADSA